jgi:hypothetical protein
VTRLVRCLARKNCVPLDRKRSVKRMSQDRAAAEGCVILRCSPLRRASKHGCDNGACGPSFEARKVAHLQRQRRSRCAGMTTVCAFSNPLRLKNAGNRRVGKGALRAVPTTPVQNNRVGSLRSAHPTHLRHPEVLASLASLEGWTQQRCLRPILRGAQGRAPQDDVGVCGVIFTSPGLRGRGKRVPNFPHAAAIEAGPAANGSSRA